MRSILLDIFFGFPVVVVSTFLLGVLTLVLIDYWEVLLVVLFMIWFVAGLHYLLDKYIV